MKKSNLDKLLAAVFFGLTLLFIILAMNKQSFFDWIFDRHHNQWSWYLRPIFLIPFCFFAYKKSWSGISFTIFCLFTSMFWFNKPDVIDPKVITFLQFEKDWLYGNWNIQKSLLFLTVPISFLLLGMAFWKRNLLFGLIVILLMGFGKIIWSIQNAGESGKSIVLPAILGLIICCVVIFFVAKKMKKN